MGIDPPSLNPDSMYPSGFWTVPTALDMARPTLIIVDDDAFIRSTLSFGLQSS